MMTAVDAVVFDMKNHKYNYNKIYPKVHNIMTESGLDEIQSEHCHIIKKSYKRGENIEIPSDKYIALCSDPTLTYLITINHIINNTYKYECKTNIILSFYLNMNVCVDSDTPVDIYFVKRTRVHLHKFIILTNDGNIIYGNNDNICFPQYTEPFDEPSIKYILRKQNEEYYKRLCDEILL
jgi:hypothetical protein